MFNIFDHKRFCFIHKFFYNNGLWWMNIKLHCCCYETEKTWNECNQWQNMFIKFTWKNVLSIRFLWIGLKCAVVDSEAFSLSQYMPTGILPLHWFLLKQQQIVSSETSGNIGERTKTNRWSNSFPGDRSLFRGVHFSGFKPKAI